jgi:hypothetical protein
VRHRAAAMDKSDLLRYKNVLLSKLSQALDNFEYLEKRIIQSSL